MCEGRRWNSFRSMQVRPYRPRAKRPKDSWDIRAQRGLALLRVWKSVGSSSAPAGPCINPQGSAALGLQTGRPVLQHFLLLLTIHSFTFFYLICWSQGGVCPIPPWQAVSMLTDQLSPLYFVQMFCYCMNPLIFILSVQNRLLTGCLFYLAFYYHLVGRVIN